MHRPVHQQLESPSLLQGLAGPARGVGGPQPGMMLPRPQVQPGLCCSLQIRLSTASGPQAAASILRKGMLDSLDTMCTHKDLCC